LLRSIPYQFQDVNRPFQMVNDPYSSYEFFGHAGGSLAEFIHGDQNYRPQASWIRAL
jgi:hypothetical protein